MSEPSPSALEPQPARYGAAMARHFGPLYYIGIGKAIGRIRLEDHAVEAIREASTRGPIVYVLPRCSSLDHLALNAALASHHLPLSVWAPNIRTTWWLPLREAWDDVRYRMSELFFGRWAPDPVATGWVVRALRANQALTWFTEDRAGWFGPRPVGFEGLVPAADLDPAVQIVPMMIVWDRAPDVSDPLVRFFLGKQGVPSLFRRWWRALRSADAFVHVGRPIDLHALKERVGTERLASVLQRALKRVLRDERRLVHGPRLLPHRTMKQLVLDNPPMRELAASEAAALGRDPLQTRREMSRHYDRIAANFSWPVIQMLHLVLRPLWTRVFSGVDARPEDIECIRAAMRDGSVVLAPCHKSHFDYVLMSWVMYDHDLIVPHVIAGLNLAVWPVSILLRGAGGFFIKRTLGDDKLFPAVFSRYLRELLHQEYPVEFFIEGGRTRSGRLMTPKVGVLSMVLDAASVRAHGRDVTILPIALAYEQVAEEGAYARELGGEQKRPESMRELLRARSVLRRRFGKVYLRVAEPIRCGNIVDASPGWPQRPPEQRKEILSVLGAQIMHRIGASMVLLPTALVSTALLSIPRRAVRHSELLARIYRFDALFRHRGVPRAASLDRLEQAVHLALDRFVRDGRIEPLEADGERLWAIDPDQRIFLEFYKNQILHVLAAAGLAACALRPEEGPTNIEHILPRFEMLHRLFRREFVWDPDANKTSLLRRGIEDLVAHGAVHSDDSGEITVADDMKIGEIYGLVRPLLEGYAAVLGAAIYPRHKDEIPSTIQSLSSALLSSGRITRPESLSLVTLQNAVKTLMDEQVLVLSDDQLHFDATAAQRYRSSIEPMVAP